MKFLLDANVFIQANKQYYAFDTFPGFWECLIFHHKSGQVWSIDRVKQELEKGNDEITKWVKNDMPTDCFIPTDETTVINAYGQIINWVFKENRFSLKEKNKFAQIADGWLVAYAKVYGYVLVTLEEPAPNAQKIKVPDVCQRFGVNYIKTFGMLKKLGVRFHWKKGT